MCVTTMLVGSWLVIVTQVDVEGTARRAPVKKKGRFT